MIYLASPYSHPDPVVREARFRSACRAAGALMASGEIVFSPIAHTHPIALACALPLGWEYWERFDREFIEASTKVVVLMLPGWKQSKCVMAEVGIARSLKIPVHYIDPPAEVV